MEKFKKITEDNFDDFIEDSYDNWLANRVKTFFIGINVDNESDLQYSLVGCESMAATAEAVSWQPTAAKLARFSSNSSASSGRRQPRREPA